MKHAGCVGRQGCEPPSYPFASLERAVDLFLTGPPDGDCARTKLAAFIYALTDAGFDISDDSLRCALRRGSVVVCLLRVRSDQSLATLGMGKPRQTATGFPALVFVTVGQKLCGTWQAKVQPVKGGQRLEPACQRCAS